MGYGKIQGSGSNPRSKSDETLLRWRFRLLTLKDFPSFIKVHTFKGIGPRGLFLTVTRPDLTTEHLKGCLL